MATSISETSSYGRRKDDSTRLIIQKTWLVLASASSYERANQQRWASALLHHHWLSRICCSAQRYDTHIMVVHVGSSKKIPAVCS